MEDDSITHKSQPAGSALVAGEAHAARLLAELARRTAASLDLQETLQLVVQSVGQLGFGCAAMNLRKPDGMFEVVAIVGPDEATQSLLGARSASKTWLSLLEGCEQWGDLRFLDHRADQTIASSMPGWRPAVAPTDEPGAWHPDDCLFAPMCAPDGSLVGVLSVDLPVSGYRPEVAQRRLLELYAVHATLAIEHARVHTLIAESEQLFRAMFDHAPIAIALQGEQDRRIIRVNAACERLLGRTVLDLAGHPAAELVPPALRPGRRAADAAADPYRPFEIHFTRPDGSEVWGRVSSTLLAAPTARGEPRLVLTQIENITQLRVAQAQLAHEATHDRLTGLPNRALVVDRLEQALDDGRDGGAGPAGGPVAVLFCDLDRFKEVNDSLGHAAGDQLLAEVAQRLSQGTREQDLAGRLGGDEFVMICCPVQGPDEAASLAERTLQDVQQPLRLGRQTITPSMSVGVALSVPGDLADDILAEADRALYAAKAAGRGQWRLAPARVRRTAKA